MSDNPLPGVKNNLRLLMAERNLVYRDIEQAIQISASTLTRIVKNHSVTTKALVKLCNYLDVSFAELLTFAPDGTD